MHSISKIESVRMSVERYLLLTKQVGGRWISKKAF